MKNFWLMVGCVLLLASASLAKDKLTSQWNCPKTTDAHNIDVGDEANHVYSISKTTCTESKGGMNTL
jgi:hypothetical protein